MPRHLSLAVTSAAIVPLFTLLTAGPGDAAEAEPGLSYSWVGSSIHEHADGHSWTDRRNWQPEGVPGDGDAVNIVSPQSGPCDIHVDQVPMGLTLANFLLSTSTTGGCQASISGGSITINGTFVWTGGTVNTPFTIGDGSGAHIGDEPVRVVERLRQPFVVLGGGLRLASAHVYISKAGSVTLDSESNLSIGFDNDVHGPRNGRDRASFVNRGTISSVDGTLSLDRVALDQGGAVDLDADSTIEITHGSLRSRDGAEYGGPGRLTIANGASAVLAREQVLSDGFHLELGPRGRSAATLDGVAQLTGDGSLDWTGGTIGAFLTLDPGVTLHASGHHAGTGRRVLSGHDTRHDSPQHDIVCHGPVVIEDGARIIMTKRALLTVASDGSLTMAPGSEVKGTSSGQFDAIRVSGTTVSVPADAEDSGPVVLDNVAYTLEGGQTDVALGSELLLTGDVRGDLAQAALTGGGTLSVAVDMDVVSAFSFEDASVLRLLPNGALDGTAVYTGDGSFEWLGGELSGNDVAFALNDMTVGGRTTKSIGDEDGFTSFVQVVNPVTFTPGTKTAPNLLDMDGNSFQSFAACTVLRNVVLRDGAFVSSVGALVFEAGPRGTIVSEVDTQIFSSGPLTFASGTLVSKGAMMLNDGAVDIREGATVRLPDPSHPLMLQGGSLTGAGTVDGDIVQSAGVFFPLASGAEHQLAVHGSYVLSGGGRLVLDIGSDSAPYAFDGAVAVAGIVTYNNLVGFAPGFGDQRTLLTAGSTLDWTPGCEETTGTRSSKGHWEATPAGQSLLATFRKLPGGTC